MSLKPGPVMADLLGLTLTEQDKKLLAHPALGGIILFSRNFESAEQVADLVAQTRAIRPELIIAVDQEGGRVQRFQSGFTRLPPMRLFAEHNDLTLCGEAGWLMAAEILACGVDISFAPVLDLDFSRSDIIGNRAFSGQPDEVVRYAGAFIEGMLEAGMAATGKHFPGHGHVVADSHLEIPVDSRPLEQIEQQDLVPFKALSRSLAGIMPAHVIYSQISPSPAGFSHYWLQNVLRQQCVFDGLIFSDDLSMEGASVAGDYCQRADAALEAGCDMVLVCNNPGKAWRVLEYLSESSPLEKHRYEPIKGRFSLNLNQLKQTERWQKAHSKLEQLGDT